MFALATTIVSLATLPWLRENAGTLDRV